MACVHAPSLPVILVVEDDPTTSRIFQQILEEAGYRVQVESSAEAALRIVSTLQPAGVILDLHLPQASGVEYLRHLRSTSAGGSLPVALVTGDYLLDESIDRELSELGARVYFKPVWEEDLRRIVDQLLRSDSISPGRPG